MNSMIYIQWGFWQKLRADRSREGIRSLVDVSEILEKSKVITDIPVETIQQDDFLMVLLLKEQQPTPCDSYFIEKKVSELNTDSCIEDLCATYMLDKSGMECEGIEKDFGIVAVCAESIVDRRYLFKGDGFTMERNIKYTQRYLSFKNKLSLPCNSAIIIDPYLLMDKRINIDDNSIQFPAIENNLESLLSAILPVKMKPVFHLTIMSSLKDPADRKKVYEKTKKCLKRIRKDLYIKLCLIYIPTGFNHNVESFHSRHIETNTFTIDAEDGLDLFDRNGYLTKNNPSVSIVFPRLFGDSRQDITKYYNWIRSAKKYIDDNEEYVCGEKNNRLFELIQIDK